MNSKCKKTGHNFESGECTREDCYAMLEEPACEVCGEDKATVRFEFIGACDECAAKVLRQQLDDLTGKVCANVSRRSNGYLTVCLAPFGVEHDHD